MIVSSFNKLDLSKNFLASLRRFPPENPFEIIWIDDASNDGTQEWLSGALSGTNHRLIINTKNRGFAINNNIGAQNARGELLVLLNNDLILTKNWLGSLVLSMGCMQNVGVVGQIQLRPKSGVIDHAGVCYDMIGRPDHYLAGRPLSYARGSGCFSSAVTAACCVIRRDLFLSVGGFDEQFRNGCEDVDLCLRLGKLGYRHWVDYRSVVYHHVSSSPGRKDYESQNLALFLQRWGHLTSKWGQEDWPKNYLSKHLYCPWKLNGVKTLDALMRLAGLKHGDSKWAAKMREEILRGIQT